MSKTFMPKNTDIKIDDISFNEESLEESNIINILSKYILLYDLPINYIIPSEFYLKEDTISFFQLDENWFFSFIDGALSLGRTSSLDYSIDQKIIEKVFKKAFENCNQIRPGLQRRTLPDKLTANSLVASGFLLRSPLVKNFRGLEFKAYDNSTSDIPLEAIRIEILNDEILIGIFVGCITKLEIIEPPEGLHFGFNVDLKESKSKTLRNLKTGELYDNENKQIVLVERDSRVIDINKLVDSMSRVLEVKREEISSSYIALEMIQNAYKIVAKEGDE